MENEDDVDFPVKICEACMSKLRPYIYVFIRTDIPLADQIVQVGHVCVDAGKRFSHPSDTRMVLLSVADEKELKRFTE